MLRRIHVTLVKMILARGNHFVITRLHSSYSNLDQRVTAGCKGKKHSRKKMLKVIKGDSFDTVKDVVDTSTEPEAIQ